MQNLIKLSRGGEHGTGGIVKTTNVAEGSVSPKWMCPYAMIKEWLLKRVECVGVRKKTGVYDRKELREQ